MKTIKLTSRPPTVAELLNMAREDVLVVTTEEGDNYVISSANEFDSEVQLLRKNHRFLAMLDQFRKDDQTIPLGEAEKRLR